ncbi:FKBP-type peptidyl-prolyl cis-trans isomerase [Wenyingzhuangia sp. IMCC45467]
MKKICITLCALLILSACTKYDSPKNYTEENEQEIIDYLEENDLEAVRDQYGLYYIIEEEGTGLQPESTDVVTVAYKGAFTNGTVFDESDEDGIILSLQRVIYGWSLGIPYFKEGGKGKLIIPSRMGYGSSDYNAIPGGSVLVFDIELLSVNLSKEDDVKITEYLEENNLTDLVTKTDSGLYYMIEETGDGDTFATESNNVTLNYTGSYLEDGEVFDEGEDTVFNLSGLIKGFKEGMTHFKEGSKGKLFIPSRLAYGSYDYGNIPGGSVLIFDIELISINN